MKQKLSTQIILLSIFFLAGFFRFYNINWDQGYHLHPDERAIVIATSSLQFPHSLSEFLSVNSPWNPHFFAYGSFPFYLLRIVAGLMSFFNPLFVQYQLINLPGRIISALSDLIAVVLLFKIGQKLFSDSIGLLAAFFYAISVLPIQLSHFYAVDTLLTCFILAMLYELILFYETPTTKRSLLIGLFLGLALATKISALVLIVSLGTALAVDFLILFLRQPHKPSIWLSHLPRFTKHLLTYSLLIGVTAALTFVLLEPYAIIDFKTFWLQTLQQSEMTHNAFIFPYTLQYVGKIPYFYEAKNIFLFGLGPLLATFAFLGIGNFSYLTFHKEKTGRWANETILLVFFFTYVFIVGKFAIGFMRYMLPVYPLLCLFGALIAFRLLVFIKKNIRSQLLFYLLSFIFYLALLIWPISFLRIYTQNNTRVTSSIWINQFIPTGKTLAIEHWDDALPLFGSEHYQTLILPLYDPDTSMKWEGINRQLQQTDFLILASNRLSTPLQKLTDCQHLPPMKCYLQTATYYKRLFSGTMGFQKVAEFTDYPTIPLFNIPINDQGADESFTVYDHPKIIIFQKMQTTTF